MVERRPERVEIDSAAPKNPVTASPSRLPATPEPEHHRFNHTSHSRARNGPRNMMPTRGRVRSPIRMGYDRAVTMPKNTASTTQAITS
jgi:hypothetical protein